jgi:hypothetical protein
MNLATDVNSSTSTVIHGSKVNNVPLGPVSTLVLGWVSSPNGRGTMDIIWGSFLTIFLCTWSSICLNVPHPTDNATKKFFRKAKWMFLAIIAPELVLSVAIGQFASARRSIRRFGRLGYSTWTLRHGFFADMGGVLLHPPDSSPFVVNSRQLAYLVQYGYLQYPQLTSEEIWDKSKADTFARILTLAQASWLVIQLIGRAAYGLPTSTLELSAAAIVFCTFGTFLCWLHKPRDVLKSISIATETKVAQILVDAGDVAASPYCHTPLDFIAKESFTWSYDVMGLLKMRCDNRERPLRCFPNDRFPNISTAEKFVLCCMTIAYAALHLIGWNFVFPSRIESLCWRLSSSIMTGTLLFFWVFETIAARQRFHRWDKYLIWLRLMKPLQATQTQLHKEIDPDDAFEQEQKKSKPIPFWEAGLFIMVILTYLVARGYMIIEAFYSLRELPLGAYMEVDFSRSFPHW